MIGPILIGVKSQLTDRFKKTLICPHLFGRSRLLLKYPAQCGDLACRTDTPGRAALTLCTPRSRCRPPAACGWSRLASSRCSRLSRSSCDPPAWNASPCRRPQTPPQSQSSVRYTTRPSCLSLKHSSRDVMTKLRLYWTDAVSHWGVHHTLCNSLIKLRFIHIVNCFSDEFTNKV